MAIAVALVSCKKEEQIVPEIKADNTEITVPTDGAEGKKVFIEFETNVDWTASLKEAIDWGSISNKKGAAGKGQVYITADPNQTNDARVAVIVVKAGTAEKEFTVTQLQKDAFSLVSDSAEIGAEGGEVEIKVMTNIPYEVAIPDDASWVKAVATKAYGEQVTKITVDAFDKLDDSRTAVFTVTAAGFEAQKFTITQKGPSTLLWSVDMHGVMNRVASYVPAGEEVAGTAVSLAVWGEYLVVCAGDGSKPVLLDKKTGEKKGELDTGDAKVMAITNDDAGNLVFSNRVYNYWTSYAFYTIWYMKPGDTKPTKLCSPADTEYYPSYIGGTLSVRGDVTKDAAIASPWEGVPGVTGDNMVLAWNVKDGVATYVKQTLTGIVAISWNVGYWCALPNNYPGYALAGTSVSDGAVMAVYNENVVYAVPESGECQKLMELHMVSDEVEYIGNYNPSAMEIRKIGGKNYFALALSNFFGGNPVITVYDADSKDVVYTAGNTISYAAEDDPKEPFSDLISTTADVMMESTEGGMILYHINNSCSSIEAFKVPLK